MEAEDAGRAKSNGGGANLNESSLSARLRKPDAKFRIGGASTVNSPATESGGAYGTTNASEQAAAIAKQKKKKGNGKKSVMGMIAMTIAMGGGQVSCGILFKESRSVRETNSSPLTNSLTDCMGE